MSIIGKKIDNKIAYHFNKLYQQIIYANKVEYLNNIVLQSGESGITEEQYCDHEVIVSLTSFGKRLYEVYLAIETIMQQTIKPNKIVLWLADELRETDIPVTLQRQQKRGLEIRYCNDIKAYKKLIPALKEYPESIIITVDDDLLYSFDLIENLINAYKKNPSSIYCLRMHRMKLLPNGDLAKYANWTLRYEKSDISPLNFPTNGGGTLFPPNCFTSEIFNEEIFMGICPFADDVWYKAMSLLNNVSSQKVYTHNKNGDDFLTNENVQDIGLLRINIDKSMNDIQIKKVFDKYDLYKYLKSTHPGASPEVCCSVR
jgi:hypothetical protein